LNAPITTSEFRTLNQCLDAATAGAVTEYSRQRDRTTSAQSTKQLGFLAHELRNLLSSAILAFEILEKGQVAIGGSTGAVLGRSLMGLRNLVDRALSEVRLRAGIDRRESVRVAEILEEVQASATIEAKARGLSLVVTPGAYDLFVEADRHLITSAVSNLVQNGIKFTPRDGTVKMTVRIVGDRVLIEVADACGGLPPGKAESLFRPYVQEHSQSGGLGLGLAIARQSVEANGGILRVQDFPGTGCVFTVDLPVLPARGSTS
jgi:signal transduction histidine kinase